MRFNPLERSKRLLSSREFPVHPLRVLTSTRCLQRRLLSGYGRSDRVVRGSIEAATSVVSMRWSSLRHTARMSRTRANITREIEEMKLFTMQIGSARINKNSHPSFASSISLLLPYLKMLRRELQRLTRNRVLAEWDRSRLW